MGEGDEQEDKEEKSAAMKRKVVRKVISVVEEEGGKCDCERVKNSDDLRGAMLGSILDTHILSTLSRDKGLDVCPSGVFLQYVG